MVQGPPAASFPAFPVSWYFFGHSRAVKSRPVARDIFGRRLAAYRTFSGQLAILDAHCSHLGADLSRGRVLGEVIQCPFHHWEYGTDGRCTRIPAGGALPASARQASFPAVERHGFIFVFNGPQALFPLPFFPEASPADFVAARPFSTVIACPWYLVSANHFDLQHFRAAHERRLVSEPVVRCPHPFARFASARFAVVGNSWQDEITRRLAGADVEMAITDWCGNLMFTTATFQGTRSYGLVMTEPLSADKVLVRVLVFLPRSRYWPGRMLFDPLRLEVRRFFIRRFLRVDVGLLDGLRYSPLGLIEADRELAAHLHWLARVAHGAPPD